MSTTLLGVAFISFIGLFLFRKLTRYIGLMDIPTLRKAHSKPTPLAGGLAIFSTILTCYMFGLYHLDGFDLFIALSAILVIVSAIDDKYDISVWLRLSIQAIVSLVLISQSNLYLHDLGNLIGGGFIHLSTFSGYVITVLGIIGAINAFNMVDGIDGLLGGLAIVSISAISYLFAIYNQPDLMVLCFTYIAALLPYVMMNLGIPFGSKFKIFMGDAGSVFIGFSIIWLILNASQSNTAHSIRPVTALWIIAVPLMDMVVTMIRRIRKGHSPLKPDREHIHHIFQRLGFSPTKTLIILCLIAYALAAVGIWGQVNNISERLMFLSFLTIFAIYYCIVSYIWRITTFARKHIIRNTNNINTTS